jgi:membrane protease YdiL (CAAX protease family)
MRPARLLAREIGLSRAALGSLRPWFLPVLGSGSALGALLGRVFVAPGSIDIAAAASLLLWQPLVEEALFRGVIQGTLQQTRWGLRARLGITASNFLSALAFAAMHLVHQPPLWALATLAPGLCFGWFRGRSGSLWPPALLHVCFNTAFFWSSLSLWT